MPTIAELNHAAPDTPVLVLFAYSKVILNRTAATRLGITEGSEPEGAGRYELVDGGVVVTGTAAVYATIAGLPSLSDPADRLNSARSFLQELNRFGITSTVDAGESNTVYPDDYEALRTLAARPEFPVQISNFLFAQKAGAKPIPPRRSHHEHKPQ